jgi:esterase/lipase superfamily enzyme
MTRLDDDVATISVDAMEPEAPKESATVSLSAPWLDHESLDLLRIALQPTLERFTAKASDESDDALLLWGEAQFIVEIAPSGLLFRLVPADAVRDASCRAMLAELIREALGALTSGPGSVEITFEAPRFRSGRWSVDVPLTASPRVTFALHLEEAEESDGERTIMSDGGRVARDAEFDRERFRWDEPSDETGIQTIDLGDYGVDDRFTVDGALGANTRAPKATVAEPGGADPVEMFFATDRLGAADDAIGTRFTGQRGDFTLGTCDVMVPRNRPLGSTVALKQGLSRLVLMFDDERIYIHRCTTLSTEPFMRSVAERVAHSERRRAFVFVHGYNVTFEEAMCRAAQLHVDLKFDGPTILYSWASRGNANPRAYVADGAAVEATRHTLADFLRTLVAQTGIQELHVLAHSMGNRALTRALEQIANAAAGGEVFAHQVVLAAPDVDRQELAAMLPAIRRISRRVTLYGSSRDKPIWFARLVAGWGRGGDGGPNLLVVPEIDSIDASAIDTKYLGHSYAMDNASLLSDLKLLLDQDMRPKDRFGIRARLPNEGWEFIPRVRP